MKKLLALLVILLVANNVNGQSELDSLYKVFQVKLDDEFSSRDQNLISVQNSLDRLILDGNNQEIERRNDISTLTEEIEQLNKILDRHYLKFKNIESTLNTLDIELSAVKGSSRNLRDSVFSNIGTLQSSLSVTSDEIEDVQIKSEKSNKFVQERLTYLFASIALIVALIIAVYLINGKRNKNVRSELGNAKAGLEAQINNANADFAEKLEKTLSELTHVDEHGVSNPQTNQGLILDFAQQIASMENNIWHLPVDDRVRKRIERATKKMRDTFMSLGYEMPKLLGTEVSDNQTIEIKHRSEDSTIPAGIRIVTKIVKPLILFNGKMVQRPIVDIKENEED